YEAIIFSEGLSVYGDMLEPGKSFIITVIAEDRSEGISLRIETIQSLEEQALQCHKMMRIFLKTIDMLPQIEQNLDSEGKGEVALILIQEDGLREVEIALPKKYKVNSHVVNAIKILSGVVDVELS
ncbi:MAG: DNA polymerase III subunit alpha, partial [Bartonella sp.]|nr:DNA polymerase III subunit alpha [Bartonella sp.]